MDYLLWLSVAMVLASLILIYRSTRNPFAPLNLAVMFFVVNYVGCLLILDLGPPVVWLAFLVAVGISCSALGGLAAKWWLHHDPAKELPAFQAKRVQSRFASPPFFSMAVYSFIILGVAIVVLLFIRTGIPLFSADVNVAKIEIARQGGYLPVRFMRMYLPLLLMIYLVGYRKTVRPSPLFAAFTVLFILVAFTLIGYRGYILTNFLVPFLLLLAYHQLSKRALTLAGVAGVGSALLITAIGWHESSFRSLWDIISERFFLAEVFGGLAPIVYVMVPQFGFLHGRGFLMDIPAVLSRIGIGDPRTHNFAQYLATMSLGNNFYDVQSAPTLIGEGYANFGYPGVVVTMFLFGFVLQWIYVRTIRGPRDAFLVPVVVMIENSLLVAAHGPFVFTVIDATGSLLIFITIFLGLYTIWGLPRGGPRFRKVLPAPSPQLQPAPLNGATKKRLYPRPRWAWRRP